MTTQHTQGRLTVTRKYTLCTEDGETPVASTFLIDSVSQNDGANARRLVACWNWCEGQETEGLELSIKIGRTAKDFINEAYTKELTLIAQRDELLEALKEVAEIFGEDWREGSTQRRLGDRARAAIAKATGGQK